MSENLNRRSFGVQLFAGAAVPMAASLVAEGAELEKAVSPTEDKTRPVESLSRSDLIMEWVQRNIPGSPAWTMPSWKRFGEMSTTS